MTPAPVLVKRHKRRKPLPATIQEWRLIPEQRHRREAGLAAAHLTRTLRTAIRDMNLDILHGMNPADAAEKAYQRWLKVARKYTKFGASDTVVREVAWERIRRAARISAR